jgi:carotenoid cleavage dioxygenase
LTHDHGAGRSTGEAVFVPRQGGTAEDDGWLMSYVYDATTDRSHVVVLHAQDLAAGPVATVHLPQRVPFGFHGNWVPDA